MTACSGKESAGQPSDGALPDGQYRVEVELTGGSGRATVESPALLAVQDGALTASVVSVSYTHLDVYKRQEVPSLRTSLPSPDWAGMCSLPFKTGIIL